MTDAIRKALRLLPSDVPLSVKGGALDALAMLEAQALCALSESDDPRARCILVERLEAEREALRKALKRIVQGALLEDAGVSRLAAIAQDAIMQAALASAPSDVVLVSKDKLREIDFCLSRCPFCKAAPTQPGDSWDHADSYEFASLIGETKD